MMIWRWSSKVLLVRVWLLSCCIMCMQCARLDILITEFHQSTHKYFCCGTIVLSLLSSTIRGVVLDEHGVS